LFLKPSNALAVDVGSPKHTSTRVATWHLSTRFVVNIDTCVAQVMNELSNVGVDLPSDVDKSTFFASNFIEEISAFLIRKLKQVVEVIDDRSSVNDELWIDRDRCGWHGHRKFVAMTIEHRSALGRQRVRPRPLISTGRPQAVGFFSLQVSDTSDDAAQDQRNSRQRQTQSTLRPADTTLSRPQVWLRGTNVPP
jgi:hypothetical protein